MICKSSSVVTNVKYVQVLSSFFQFFFNLFPLSVAHWLWRKAPAPALRPSPDSHESQLQMAYNKNKMKQETTEINHLSLLHVR